VFHRDELLVTLDTTDCQTICNPHVLIIPHERLKTETSSMLNLEVFEGLNEIEELFVVKTYSV